MAKVLCLGVLVALLAVLWPQSAWALRCGTHIVSQGDASVQVRAECGAPFYVDHFVRYAGLDATTPVEPGTPVTGEAWYYNFGPQQLMVRLDFSGGVLARVETLGYGFVGSGGPCDFINIVTGMSVADLIAKCGYPASRSRNPLATAVGLGAQAPAWGETWFYAGDGSNAAREVHLQDGRVVDVRSLP